MECLVGIAQEYYVHLEPYIKDIFALTCKAVRFCPHPAHRLIYQGLRPCRTRLAYRRAHPAQPPNLC